MEARTAERAARVSPPDASCGSRKKPVSAGKKIWFPGAHTCLPPAMRASLSSLISRWVFANRSHSGGADRCSWPLSSKVISSWHLEIRQTEHQKSPQICADERRSSARSQLAFTPRVASFPICVNQFDQCEQRYFQITRDLDDPRFFSQFDCNLSGDQQYNTRRSRFCSQCACRD